MEWTPEAVKAEIDYRQAALRADAEHARVARQFSAPKRPWWRRLGHGPDPEAAQPPNGHRHAA